MIDLDDVWNAKKWHLGKIGHYNIQNKITKKIL